MNTKCQAREEIGKLTREGETKAADISALYADCHLLRQVCVCCKESSKDIVVKRVVKTKAADISALYADCHLLRQVCVCVVKRVVKT